MFEVTVEHTFPAAHALRNYYGSTEPTHGHNFRVEVVVSGDHLDEAGLLVDFIALEKAVKETLAPLDHRFLNELLPFKDVNPSAENIARYVFHALAKHLQGDARLSRVRVWETPNASATYSA